MIRRVLNQKKKETVTIYKTHYGYGSTLEEAESNLQQSIENGYAGYDYMLYNNRVSYLALNYWQEFTGQPYMSDIYLSDFQVPDIQDFIKSGNIGDTYIIHTPDYAVAYCILKIFDIYKESINNILINDTFHSIIDNTSSNVTIYNKSIKDITTNEFDEFFEQVQAVIYNNGYTSTDIHSLSFNGQFYYHINLPTQSFTLRDADFVVFKYSKDKGITLNLITEFPEGVIYLFQGEQA